MKASQNKLKNKQTCKYGLYSYQRHVNVRFYLLSLFRQAEPRE